MVSPVIPVGSEDSARHIFFRDRCRSSGGAAGEVLRMIFREEVVALMDFKLGLEYREVALRGTCQRISVE